MPFLFTQNNTNNKMIEEMHQNDDAPKAPHNQENKTNEI